MSYDIYQKVRSTSWNILLDCRVRELPVKVSKICQTYDYTLRSYTVGKEMIKAIGLEKQCTISDGFAVLHNGRYYIFYDDTCSPGRQRFTIAHEIGHITLGHLMEGGHSTENKELSDLESETEKQANQFAARLLSPACVLHAIDCVSPEQIEKTCQVSQVAAEYRSKRMVELIRRNKFLLDPLEKQVFKQFQDYIEKTKTDNP